MEMVLLIIFVAIFTVLSWRRMNLAVGFLIMALPTYLIRFDVAGIPMTVLEVMILVVIMVFFIKRRQMFFTKKLRFIYFYKNLVEGLCFSNYKWLMLAILVVATLAVWFSPARLAALGVWKAYFVEPMLLFVVIINTIKTKEDFWQLINFWGVGAVIVSAAAIYQKITGQFIPNELWAAEETRRVTSFFGYPNAVGLYLAPVVVMFAGRLITRKAGFARMMEWTGLKSVIIDFWVIICGAAAIWFAKSEGAMVAVLVGGLILGLLIKKLRVLTLMTVAAGLLVLLLVPEIQTLVMAKATLSDFSGNIRLIIWRETIQMLGDSPIWGGGLAGFQTAIAGYHHAARVFEIYLYPHNIILNFWSELGILGVIFFSFLLIKFFYNYFKAYRENQAIYLILIAVMTTILVHGIVDVPYFKNDLSVGWWFLFALSVVLIKRKNIGDEKTAG
ncbi:TPA: hypothetical protein DF272_00390 [Candidatus Falkowbacteria bacterium]|nr:hypothetical protein [Candidatus Falkowbacteria bacterium]